MMRRDFLPPISVVKILCNNRGGHFLINGIFLDMFQCLLIFVFGFAGNSFEIFVVATIEKHKS